MSGTVYKVTRGDPREARGLVSREIHSLGSQQSHSSSGGKNAGMKGKTSMPLTEDYIVGLVDGEGSFTFFPRPSQNLRWNNKVEVHLYIKMRADELPLLKKVREFFGHGRISLQRENRPNHSDCYRFEISDLRGIQQLVIPLFQRKPLQSTSREKQFKIFCKVVDLLSVRKEKTSKGWKQILKLREQFQTLRTRRVREIRSHGGNAKQT